jgi:hypothetical protein
MVTVTALIVLAGCGSAGVGGAGHAASASGGRSRGSAAAASAGVPLCTSARSMDRVVARPSASQLRAKLPRGITISGTSPSVRGLAAALCALRPMPGGQRCAARGGGYRLVFTAKGRAYRPVSIQLSGCRRVMGVGPTRSWSQSPWFGRLLRRTVGGTGRMLPGNHPSSVPTL